MFYDNGLTFKFKTIAPNYSAFEEKIKEYNYFDNFIELNETECSILYYMLITNYANSWIRQETPELFYCDLINIFISNYKKYNLLFKLIDDVYSLDSNELLYKNESENVTENNKGSASNSSNNRFADTPTTFNPSSDFVKDYTTSMSEGKTEASLNEDRKIERTKHYNLVDNLNKALKISNFPIQEMAQDYAKLFIQIDNPTIDLIYCN